MHTRPATVNLAPSHVTPARSWHGGDLQSGFGAPNLHIGQSAGEVQSLLGAPDEQVPSGEGLYYVYLSLGIDVLFGLSLQVNSLYFFNAGVERHSHAARVRLAGIELGSTRSLVIKSLGQPDLAGGPVRVGGRMKSWLCYDSGAEFDLDARNRVTTIIIFEPTKHPPH